MAIAIRTPRMMMTTRSLMSVKPSSLCSRICSLFNIRWSSFQKTRFTGGLFPIDVPWACERPPLGDSPPLGVRDAPERAKGAVSRALRNEQRMRPGLRAGAEQDVCAGAVLEERVGAD